MDPKCQVLDAGPDPVRIRLNYADPTGSGSISLEQTLQTSTLTSSHLKFSVVWFNSVPGGMENIMLAGESVSEHVIVLLQ